jgi:hypothetical protein
VIESLKERAKRVNEARLVRAWEYRQRHHSKGVWFRLRRTLVDAECLWTISDEEANRLEAEGFEPLSVGRELFPPKRIFVTQPGDIARLVLSEQLPVRISTPFLAARNLVLLPFG